MNREEIIWEILERAEERQIKDYAHIGLDTWNLKSLKEELNKYRVIEDESNN